MKRVFQCGQIFILVCLTILIFSKTTQDKPFAGGTPLTDDRGEVINLPQKVTKVFATTEAGLFAVYALEPEAILGWNRGLSPQLEFAIDRKYHNLPTLGTWDQHFETINADLIVELQPDLILHYATNNSANKELAKQMEARFSVPVMLIDNSLQNLPAALQILGQVLGQEPRGKVLATYVENRLEYAHQFQALRTNYGPIPVHLVSPQPEGYFNELLALAGMKEMIDWNNQPPFPDFVLVLPHSVADPYRVIEKDGHKRIYQVPNFPTNWLEPGSIFSLLGLEWLLSIAYPTEYLLDLPESYRLFMEVFFQVNVTPELLNWTLRRSGISF